jgi:hypothetical protein
LLFSHCVDHTNLDRPFNLLYTLIFGALGWGVGGLLGVGVPMRHWKSAQIGCKLYQWGCVHVTHSSLEERPVLVRIVQIFKILKTYIIGMCVRAQHNRTVTVHLIFVHQHDHI